MAASEMVGWESDQLGQLQKSMSTSYLPTSNHPHLETLLFICLFYLIEEMPVQ